MSISKLRGKAAIGRTNDNTTANHNGTSTTTTVAAAAAVASNCGNNKLNKSTYVPQASLLKIEPFVPSFTTRLHRPINRSYSTLSTNKPTNPIHQRLHGPSQDLSQPPAIIVKRRAQEIQHMPRQRSKSSSSLTSSMNPVTGAVVIQQPNGVCRIIRSPKEQEKLPDRINYDRRGLGAIPIFENESNLRLLSLQHNLINVFHIPQGIIVSPTRDVIKPDKETTANPIKAKLSNNARNGTKPIHQKSINTPILNKSSHLQQPIGTNLNRLMVKNSVALNSKDRPPNLSTMKKSKSFVSHYSKHINTLKRASHVKLSFSKPVDSPIQELLGSFDAGLDNVMETLNVKNNQLLTSYGETFQNLVFLDLYDNQIEKISNLDGLSSLTVLLLGKNRISDISGLASLKNTLRVLDLHGNKITSINNRINCLLELKSLNLAGNQIRQINQTDFEGLVNLRELNLKRNKIKRVHGFHHLTNLERLWLCHNDIHKVEDMSSIAKSINLLEVTIENNPVSLAGDCVSFLVSYLPKLQMLSQMPITEQVRRAAMTWRRNKELSDTNYCNLSSDMFSNIRREEVISNARTNWELLRSQQTVQSRPGVTSPMNNIEVSSTPPDINPQTISEETKQDPVKLPPIQEQNPSKNSGLYGRAAISEKTHSSGSSLGPNVDSSSSYFSSDTEERDVAPSPKSKHTTLDDEKEQSPTDGKMDKCNPSNNETNEDVKPATAELNTTDFVAVEPCPSSPTDSSIITAIIHNPSVSTVSQPSTMIAENSMAPTTSKSQQPQQQQQQQQHPQRSTMVGLAINGNNNPTNTSNANVTAKRYIHGTLTRSQAAKASSTSTNVTRTSVQLSHHNSTANNGVAGPAFTGTSSNNNLNGTIGGMASSSSHVTFPTNKGSSSTAVAPAVGNFTGKQVTDREREQGGDYLIEICGRHLNVYGLGALRFIDKQWNAQKAGDVHTFNFSYINFNNITAVLGRVKVRFPHAEHFVFRETNISCLGQLNALAELQGITSLTIDTEGNMISGKPWRLYAIYRLSHWGLKSINGKDVTDLEINEAQKLYTGLSDLVLWAMPEDTLQPLLARLRLDESCSLSKLSPKQWLEKADDALKVVVGKEALQWRKSPNGDYDHTNTRERGRMHFTHIIQNTCNAVEKLHMLDKMWPSILLDIVRNTLLDYSQMDVYVKNLMAEIMK